MQLAILCIRPSRLEGRGPSPPKVSLPPSPSLPAPLSPRSPSPPPCPSWAPAFLGVLHRRKPSRGAKPRTPRLGGGAEEEAGLAQAGGPITNPPCRDPPPSLSHPLSKSSLTFGWPRRRTKEKEVSSKEIQGRGGGWEGGRVGVARTGLHGGETRDSVLSWQLGCPRFHLSHFEGLWCRAQLSFSRDQTGSRSRVSQAWRVKRRPQEPGSFLGSPSI